MHIRVVSDLHLEFERKRPLADRWSLPHMSGDSNTVLVLAGDISVVGCNETLPPFLDSLTNRFREVLYVMGNHEFYGSTIEATTIALGAMLKDRGIKLLQNTRVDVDDVTFLGATLWTNFNNNNPLAKNLIQRSLSDYRAIKTGEIGAPKKLITDDIYNIHCTSHDFIFREASNATNDGQRVVVISHHAPSMKSVSQFFTGSPLNDAYASNLDPEIYHSGIDMWVHGHMHNSVDYMIGDTRVVANPKGYPGNDLNTEFDPCLRFNS